MRTVRLDGVRENKRVKVEHRHTNPSVRLNEIALNAMLLPTERNAGITVVFDAVQPRRSANQMLTAVQFDAVIAAAVVAACTPFADEVAADRDVVHTIIDVDCVFRKTREAYAAHDAAIAARTKVQTVTACLIATVDNDRESADFGCGRAFDCTARRVYENLLRDGRQWCVKA